MLWWEHTYLFWTIHKSLFNSAIFNYCYFILLFINFIKIFINVFEEYENASGKANVTCRLCNRCKIFKVSLAFWSFILDLKKQILTNLLKPTSVLLFWNIYSVVWTSSNFTFFEGFELQTAWPKIFLGARMKTHLPDFV